LGSILGILYGYSYIPKKWIEPIGTTIKTCPQVNGFRIPKDIEELTGRTIKAHNILMAEYENCLDKDIFKSEEPAQEKYLHRLSTPLYSLHPHRGQELHQPCGGSSYPQIGQVLSSIISLTAYTLINSFIRVSIPIVF
jgi:hypothetical protein